MQENGGVDPNVNPEPFEQTEVISDYPMNNLYNKKKVPYIEKNNGGIYIKTHGDYKTAIEHYNKALFSIKILLEDQNLNVGDEYAEKVINEVEIPVSSNLTLCYLKVEDYQNVIKYADKILQVEEDNVKILYRKGMAHTQLMDFEQAKEALMKANKIEPNNKMILEGLKAFKQKKYDYKYKTQQICQKIFDKDSETLYPDNDKKEEEKKETNELEQGSIPFYLNKTLELGFALPLLVYKGLLEKPTSKVLNFGASLITLPDCLPVVGGLWKKTRSGTARVLRTQFARILDRKSKPKSIR